VIAATWTDFPLSTGRILLRSEFVLRRALPGGECHARDAPGQLAAAAGVLVDEEGAAGEAPFVGACVLVPDSLDVDPVVEADFDERESVA